MTMAIRVPDADALSDATNAALALTTELGGHVAASNVDTDGSSGEAQLRLSIPVGKVEDAVVRLSALGTITHQNVQTVDLQGRLDSRAKQVERIQRAIVADELRLASGTLTAEEKLLTELRLAGNRADLREVRRVRALLAKQAANAELALTLRTGSEPAGSDDDQGGVAGAVDDGFAFLAAAGTVALLVFIAASPLHRACDSGVDPPPHSPPADRGDESSTSRAPARPARHPPHRNSCPGLGIVRHRSGTVPRTTRANVRDTLRREGCPSRGPPGDSEIGLR